MKPAATLSPCHALKKRYDRGERCASIVLRATPKSIAKARPRPSGPVTSHARALVSGDTSGASRVVGEDAFLEQRPMTRCHRAARTALVEGDAAILGEVEQ